MRLFEQAQHALALRYGTELPKPPKLKLSLPAFSVGSCDTMLFSPSGEHLLVPTNNGCFLWEVASGKKLLRLKGPSNPVAFSFNPDGSNLLMRNEQSQFAIFSIPHGELLAKFNAKYEFRMDGSGCLGPDPHTVLQLAHHGVLLVLDAANGKVLQQRQLEATGYSGEVYWLPGRNEVIVAQTSVANWRNISTPCALWRWAGPLNTHEPTRLPGSWISLNTALLQGKDALLLHYQPSAQRRDEYVIEVLDLSAQKITLRIPCGGSIVPHPTISHDSKAWAATTNAGIQLGLDGARIVIPTSARGAQFHPSRDLVAIPGEEGFVAPLSVMRTQLPTLGLHHDVRELTLRGYARLTTLPNKVMPPRIMVFAGALGWLIQAERLDGRHYLALEECTRVEPGAGPQRMADALADALKRSRSGKGSLEPSTAAERRHFLGGTVTPPTTGWSAAVAVSFADDAIDLWPLKPSGDSAFGHTWYPVAAIEPGARGEKLAHAVERMLHQFKPRKSG